MKQQGLHEKAGLLTLFRLLIALVLLVATLFFGLSEGLGVGTLVAEILYGAVTALLLFSVLASMALDRWSDPSRVTLLAYLQIVGDALFSTALVLITGGCESLFTFLYSLSIVNAGVVLFRRGALFSATVNVLCLSLVALAQAEVFGATPASFVSSGALFSQPAVGLVELRDLLPHFVVNVLAFYGIAFLSGYLAEQLRTAAAVAEQQRTGLRELTTLYDNIVSSLENGLLTVGLDRRITFANTTACSMVGRRSQDVVGRRVDELFPDMGPVLDNPDKLQGTRSEVTTQVVAGRTLYLRWSVSPLRDSAGRSSGHILLLFDITPLREMEEQVKRSEHMAALGRLASSIAHEIRNPLASMSGSIQLLRDSLDVQGSDRKLMDIVVREADSLSRWIGGFLDYARPRRFVQEKVDLAEMARSVVEMLRNDERSRGVEVVLDVQGPVVMEGDRFRLEAVLWNLSLNAVQSVGSGGRVVVRLAAGAGDVELAVSDNGPGVPPDLRQRIFEPFFTTRERGTGLGLPTAYRNVLDHSGTITVGPGADGTGATFTVRLPVQPAAPPAGVTETGQWRR